MRWVKYFFAILFSLLLIYVLGPHPSKPKYNLSLPILPRNPIALQNHIARQEAAHKIKPNNEARIVWANDSVKQKTEYSIVYLHGFSASQEEGNPVHRNIAKMFGCNLYLSRLAEHGIDTTDALINFTPDKLWESAKEALSIGKQLGNKVILMGTSTGGTLALQLAAAYKDVAGIILLSPNIEINDPNAWLLNNPWGLQLARLVKKSKFNIIPNTTPAYKQYWNDVYRLEATAQLEELLETGMTANTFAQINQPTLVLYYYKDEKNQDKVVKVSAMKEMFEQLSTVAEQKKMVAIPNTGSHVLGSPIVSHDIISPQNEIALFLSNVMQLKAVQQ
jgi:esterase/lipase